MLDGYVRQDVMFLPLDDVLEEGKNIDLPVNTKANSNKSNNPLNGRIGKSRRSSIAPGGNAVSFGDDAYGYHGSNAWDSGEAMPWAGSGTEKDGGKNLQEINRPAMFLMEQDYGNSFKMSTCAVDRVS